MSNVVKTFLFIAASIGTILLCLFGLAKGSFAMASLGLVLTIVGLPVLFFIVLLLPNRWFS